MIDIYVVTVDNSNVVCVLYNLKAAIEYANNAEKEGHICEIHYYKEDKIISRQFWKEKGNENEYKN